MFRRRQDFKVTLYRQLSYLVQGASKSPRWALKWGHHRNTKHDYNLKWRSNWYPSMWIKFYRSLFWTWIGLAISREVNLRPTQTLLQSLCEIFHPQTRRRRHRTEKSNKSRRLLYSRNETNIMINTLQFSYFSEGGVDWSHSGWFYDTTRLVQTRHLTLSKSKVWHFNSPN